jgi:hypothetical protein
VDLNYQVGPGVYTMFHAQATSAAAPPFINSISGAGISGFTVVPGSISGSGQATTFAHAITFGSPITFNLGLFSYAEPGGGLGSTLDSHFGAYVSGIEVTGPLGQIVPDFVVVTGSGVHYGPTGVAGAGNPGPTGQEDAARLWASPNPTSSGTRITFSLPLAGTVQLGVHDAEGRLVRILRNGQASQGSRQEAWWDGRNAQGKAMPSGIYYARLQWNGQSRTTRVTLIR